MKRQNAWGRLYNAANAVAVRVGADGEISAIAPEISTLMDALAEIDGGQWCPGIMPCAPQPPIDNAFVAEGCEQFSQPGPVYRLADAVLDLNSLWNARRPEAEIADALDLCRRLTATPTAGRE